MLGILIFAVVTSIYFAEAQITARPNSFTGVSGSSSAITRQTYQPSFQTYYTSSDIDTYWPILRDSDQCEGRQDLTLQVAPAGCQPAVVRSDLLAEQNVPVFCQINALELNPFIDVKNIKNIRFRGEYPKEVAAVGFHPARSALRTKDQLIGSPLINNIGYVVVVLKKNPIEKTLPEFVNVTLSGQVEYDSINALGVGRAEFLLKEVSDEEWEVDKNKQSFWQGQYFVRLEDVDESRALVAIYKGDKKISSTQVKLGETSKEIYVPGGYCKAGVQIAFDGFEAARDTARIEVGDSNGKDILDVYVGSRFLNDKCRVRKIRINPDGETGSVDVRCGSERVLLESKPFASDIFVNDLNQPVQPALVDGNPVVDLGARGKYSLSSNDNLVVLGGQGGLILTDAGIAEIARVNNVETSFLINLEDALIEFKYKKVSTDKKPQLLKDRSLLDEETEKSLTEAIEAYERVSNDYPSEKPVPGELKGGDLNRPYGEQALQKAIELASSNGKSAKEAELINTFIEKYPNSELVSFYQNRITQLYTVDSSLSGSTIYLDNQYRTIRLVKFTKPSKDANAEFTFGSTRPILKLGEQYSIGSFYFNLTSLDSRRATISTNCDREILGTTLREPSRTVKGGGTFTLSLDERYDERSIRVCNDVLVLDRINVEEVARVRLLPKVKGTMSDINMSVRVGIEKRLIQLSPEKTKERITNINKSIEQWEKISKNLADVVKTLKTACFATNAVLTVKNFLSGFSGEALARQRAMQGDHGWNAQCGKLVDEGKYPTLNACFVGEADKINGDVKIIGECIKEVNTEIKSIDAKHPGQASNDIFGGGKTVDRATAVKEQAESVLGKSGDKNIYNQKGEKIGTVNDILSNTDGYKEGIFNNDQLRDLQLNLACRGKLTGGSAENAEADLARIFAQVKENKQSLDEFKKAEEARKIGEPRPFRGGLAATSVAEVFKIETLKAENIKKELGKTAQFSDSGVTHYSKFIAERSPSGKGITVFETGTYYLGLKQVETGSFQVIKAIKDKGNAAFFVIEDPAIGQFVDFHQIGIIKSADQVNYFNSFKDPQVRYYENEPYKGMPALVPFDLRSGWYAATKQTIPVFGGQQAFEASGRVSSFWLCNVGPNGKADFFEGIRDDICQQINLNTNQPYGVFSNLGESQARELVGKGVQAITQAAEQYGSGRGPVRILGQTISRGAPAANVPSVQCQNFMDPKDCQLMFNVCDPVICPASRCNFGGQYQVADVVQTGIVGSALLCLPNYREGIYVPVCLTGIQAGVDSYVSILKSHRDCLQENLDSGKLVGICDQIYSIYSCEFFWRQVAPVANALLPRLVETLFGRGGARGGGEYLTVNAAFDNSRKSIDYFTQVYAVNSLKAFKARNVEEIGTDFCKAWISAKAPTVFKNLIEPESPPQFYAWFDAVPFSTVTVPATSQYKVFYHIFGGKDTGVSYSVYLKSPPEAGFYATTQTITVATGFITKGQAKSESKDFTAPEGYKELCVRINAEEKCGFRQVSTDFALNQLRDSYVKEQSTQKDIKSEKECIWGTPSFGALLNPNIQAGVEEAAIPEIYNRGVVRICATTNPGSSTDPTRFVDVGQCDDPKLRCWIDKKSVSNAITDVNKGVRNATLSDLEQIQKTNLEQKGEFLPDQNALDEIKRLEGNKSSLQSIITISNRFLADNLIFEIDRTSEKVILNPYKARLLLLRAEVKEIVAKAYLNARKSAVKAPTVAEAAEEKTESIRGTSEAAPVSTSTLRSYIIEKRDRVYYYVIFIDSEGRKIDTGYYFDILKLYKDIDFARDPTVGSSSNGKITIIDQTAKGLLIDLDKYSWTYQRDPQTGTSDFVLSHP